PRTLDRQADGRANLESRLTLTLDTELERERIGKAASPQHLRAIRKKLHERACEAETDFVNHIPSGSESVVQRRFECRKCGRPDARSGDYRGLACAYC